MKRVNRSGLCVVAGWLFCVAIMAGATARANEDSPFVDSLPSGGADAEQLVVFVADGEPKATIILPEETLRVNEMAADFLVEYVERMSGATLPIVRDPAEVQTEHRIWVGMRPELETVFPDGNFTFDEPEQLYMLARPNELALVGRDEAIDGEVIHAGSLLSVLTFLQERLDIRFLWPGELGTDVIETQTIAFEPFEYRYSPQVRHRVPRATLGFNPEYYKREDRRPAPNEDQMVEELYGGYEAVGEVITDLKERSRLFIHMHRSRAQVPWQTGNELDEALQGSSQFSSGHAFTKWYDRFAEEHPDWFALQPDGTRVSEQEDPYPSKSRVKLCISNPEVADQIVKEAIAFFEANPGATTRSVSPNDHGWHGYCVCENCTAWDPEDAPLLGRELQWENHSERHVQLTDRYARFWNIISRRLNEHFPDREVNLGIWAYTAYSNAPYEVELENIIPGYVGIIWRQPGTSHAARIREALDTWRGWIEKGAAGMVWRPNHGKRTAGMPYVSMHRMGDIWNELAENKIVGFEVDSVHHNWANQGPHLYLMLQLIWNPRLKARDVLDDYYERAFGPEAAEYVDAYFAVFEQAHYKVTEYRSRDNAPSWHMYSGIPHAFNETRLAPTLGRDMANHAWDNYLWNGPDARYTSIQLAESYLSQAEQAVANGPEKYRERVAFLRAGLEFTKAQVDVVAANNDIRERRGDRAEAIERAREASQRRERIILEHLPSHAFGYPQMLGSYRLYSRSYRRMLAPPPEDMSQW